MRAADSDACNRGGACRAFGYVGSLTNMEASSLHREISVSLLCVNFLAVKHLFFWFVFFRAPFCRCRLVKHCFTGQSPGKAISIPAAPDVQGNPATSKPRLLRGGLGHDWCAGVGLGLRREAGW